MVARWCFWRVDRNASVASVDAFSVMISVVGTG